MPLKKIILFIILTSTLLSCGVYKFNQGDVGDAKTINIAYFPNNASLVEPTLSQKFTIALQDVFTQQTNLELTKNNADLVFEGEITRYDIFPVAATSNQTAALNRLTISVKVQFYNTLKEEDNFDKTFSHFYDFPANDQLIGGTLDTALKEIFERITQNIFNESVAKW